MSACCYDGWNQEKNVALARKILIEAEADLYIMNWPLKLYLSILFVIFWGEGTLMDMYQVLLYQCWLTHSESLGINYEPSIILIFPVDVLLLLGIYTWFHSCVFSLLVHHTLFYCCCVQLSVLIKYVFLFLINASMKLDLVSL